jgi:hypothetical protein
MRVRRRIGGEPYYCATFSLNPKVRFETGLLASEILGFRTMPPLTAISNVGESCDFPTGVAAEVLRRNAIRSAEWPVSRENLIVLDQ